MVRNYYSYTEIESEKRNAELPLRFRYLTEFIFCLCTASKLSLLLLDSSDEFVIKYVLIIFDDFEEKERDSREELKVQRGLKVLTFLSCCVNKSFLGIYVLLLMDLAFFSRLKERGP